MQAVHKFSARQVFLGPEFEEVSFSYFIRGSFTGQNHLDDSGAITYVQAAFS